MTTLSKSLLAVCVTGTAAGIIIDSTGFNLNPAWTVALPFGAVFYGLFLISFMLEKEAAKFDAEAANELRLLQPAAAPAPKSISLIPPALIPLPTEKFGH